MSYRKARSILSSLVKARTHESFPDSIDPLLIRDIHGTDAPINVGWGDKSTQFHGSLGKAAATSTIPAAAVGASPDDDGHARISWRGDGAYFTVSVLEGANEVQPI